MPKAVPIRRGPPGADEPPTEPAEWAEWRRKNSGAKGDGPASRPVRIPEQPGLVSDTSFGSTVEVRVGDRR